MKTVSWDVERLIEDCGGVKRLHELLSADDGPRPPGVEKAPTLGAVRAWVRRGAVPSDWLAVLLCITVYNVNTYLVQTDAKPLPSILT